MPEYFFKPGERVAVNTMFTSSYRIIYDVRDCAAAPGRVVFEMPPRGSKPARVRVRLNDVAWPLTFRKDLVSPVDVTGLQPARTGV